MVNKVVKRKLLTFSISFLTFYMYEFLHCPLLSNYLYYGCRSSGYFLNKFIKKHPKVDPSTFPYTNYKPKIFSLLTAVMAFIF